MIHYSRGNFALLFFNKLSRGVSMRGGSGECLQLLLNATRTHLIQSHPLRIPGLLIGWLPVEIF